MTTATEMPMDVIDTTSSAAPAAHAEVCENTLKQSKIIPCDVDVNEKDVAGA